MKNLFFLLALSLLFSSSCKKVDEFTQFDLSYSQTITIPASSGLNLPFNLFTPETETNAESSFAVNDTRKDLIEEITLKSLKLSIKSPTDGDFRFLKSIQVFLNAEGLSELEIASLNPVPDNVGASIDLEISENDLKEYIKKENFSLRVNTVTDELLDDDYQIEVASKFFVDAQIIL